MRCFTPSSSTSGGVNPNGVWKEDKGKIETGLHLRDLVTICRSRDCVLGWTSKTHKAIAIDLQDTCFPLLYPFRRPNPPFLVRNST